MKSSIKVVMICLFAMVYVNCAPKGMQSQSDPQKVTGDNSISNNGSVISSSQGDMVTLPLESSAPLAQPSNNLPIEVNDLPNELITLLTPPVDTSATPSSTSGGISGFLGGLIGNIFGIDASVGSSAVCGILSPLLSVGATLLTGGNPIVGMLVPQIASSLLSCGKNTSLASLIPSGASADQQIFSLISQILQANDQGIDPTPLLNAIKNPQDLDSILSIVSTLVNKTGDSSLQNLLSRILNFKNNYNSSIGTCGNMNAMACQVFQLVNGVRQQKGLPALAPNTGCTLAAQAHSKDMLTNKILSHASSDGTSAKARLSQYGVGTASAENIVKGSKLTAQQAVAMWMGSASHKNNILNASFTSGGVGYVNGYFTQCFSK